LLHELRSNLERSMDSQSSVADIEAELLGKPSVVAKEVKLLVAILAAIQAAEGRPDSRSRTNPAK
jgi:hypothetical protein